MAAAVVYDQKSDPTEMFDTVYTGAAIVVAYDRKSGSIAKSIRSRRHIIQVPTRQNLLTEVNFHRRTLIGQQLFCDKFYKSIMDQVKSQDQDDDDDQYFIFLSRGVPRRN